jgi:predicted dehydrogenase
LANNKGAFSTWGGTLVPSDMDVEDFAAAFVRFDNGATLILEVSWLIHHDTEGEDMRMWLYGNDGGLLWPNGEFYNTNYETKQFNNRTIKLTQNIMEPHALECVEFARVVANGEPSPVPAEQSLQVMTILDGIYRSQETGREVLLTE